MAVLSRILSALLLVTLSACGSAPPAADGPLQRFVRQTTNDGIGRPRFVRKWEAPVRVALIGPQSERWRLWLARQLEDIRRSTGHDVALTEDADSANFRVLLVETLQDGPWSEHAASLDWYFRGDAAEIARARDRADHHARDAYCYALVPNGAAAVSRALAVIPVSIGHGAVFACLIEETTHTFGLYDHEVAGSFITFGSAKPMTLTPQDRLFLRMLYDPRIRSGMTAEQVTPLAEDILSRIVP